MFSRKYIYIYSYQDNEYFPRLPLRYEETSDVGLLVKKVIVTPL